MRLSEPHPGREQPAQVRDPAELQHFADRRRHPEAAERIAQAAGQDAERVEDGVGDERQYDQRDEPPTSEAALGEAESVKVIWQPQNTVPVDEDRAQSLMKLVATLEDDDDVQNVYANFEVDEATMAKLSAA